MCSHDLGKLLGKNPSTLMALDFNQWKSLFEGAQENFHSTHGKGAFQLLKMRDFDRGRNGVEAKLFLNLHGTVVMQSFINPEIQFSDQEWRSLTTFKRSKEISSPRRSMGQCGTYGGVVRC